MLRSEVGLGHTAHDHISEVAGFVQQLLVIDRIDEAILPRRTEWINAEVEEGAAVVLLLHRAQDCPVGKHRRLALERIHRRDPVPIGLDLGRREARHTESDRRNTVLVQE